MKHLFIVCLFILLPKIFNGQTYAYKPIGFDTSCYWVEHWHMYDGGDPMDCAGERLISIEKDTIINGVNYWKGKRYRKNHRYLEMPWEVEAFSKQELLFRRTLER